jgi:uncharacterized protein with HEPN domain
MPKSPSLALIHVYDAIERVALLRDLSVQDLKADWLKRAAAERMISILSEATRRLKPEWKSRFPDVPWQDIAGIGSVLRHDYEQLDPAVIVKLRTEGRLDRLRTVVESLLDEIEPDWRRTREERRHRWP